MRLVMFVRISRCPEYWSSYLPFEENHAQTKCAKLTTETVFKSKSAQCIQFCLKGQFCPISLLFKERYNNVRAVGQGLKHVFLNLIIYLYK